MAVIFFDGFTRPLDLAYWTNTGGTVSLATINANARVDGSVSFTNSNPVVNNLRLSNIGTHTNKKLYFGIRLQQLYVQHDQPFLKFYDASDNVVLTLQWNTVDVTTPDVGLNVVKYSAYTPVTGAPVYNLTVGGVAYKVTLLNGNYADNSARFNTTEMPWWGNQTTANAWATAWCEQGLPEYAAGTHGSLDPFFGWQIRPFSQFNPYVVDGVRPSYVPESSCTPGTDSISHDTEYYAAHRWVILDLSLNPPTTGTIAATYVVDNDIAPVVWSVSATDPGLFVQQSVLEFELDLTAYTLAIKFSDQSLQTISNVTTLSGLTSAINTITGLAFFGSTVGGAIFDIYLIDDTGSFANTWLGSNFRVHSQTFGGSPQVNTGWVNGTNGAPDVSVINDNDSDASFIRTGALNNEVAWALNNINAGGFNPAVAGIRMSSVSRRLQLDSAYKYFYYDEANFGYGVEMGTRMVLSSDNYSRQTLQFIDTNPLTAAQWTVDDINTHGGFGVKSVDPT